MNFFKQIIRAVVTALVFSIFLKILIGIYSVIGISSLFLTVVVATVVSLINVKNQDKGYFGVTVVHIIFAAFFSIIIDKAKIFSSLSNTTAAFFEIFLGNSNSDVNAPEFLIITLITYFGALIIASVLLGSANQKNNNVKNEMQY